MNKFCLVDFEQRLQTRKKEKNVCAQKKIKGRRGCFIRTKSIIVDTKTILYVYKKNVRKKFRYSVFVEEKNLNSSFQKDKDEGSFYDLPRRNMVFEIEIYVQTYVYLFLIYSHYVLFRE